MALSGLDLFVGIDPIRRLSLGSSGPIHARTPLCHGAAPKWRPIASVVPVNGSLRFDAHPITDGAMMALLASEIALGGLDRDVPKQRVNLVQVAAGKVTQSR